MTNFSEFVAIKLSQASEQSIDRKAISSFLSATGSSGSLSVAQALTVWVATMVVRGLSPSSRRRYIGKLSSIYKEYAAANEGIADSDDPFAGLASLADVSLTANAQALPSALSRLESIFDVILADAEAIPEVALFVYLLFNASSDIAKAVTLTVDTYIPTFPQLDDIIRPADFHHRRRYIFDLGQSRKRVPQLVRETTTAIDLYLRKKDIRFPEPLSASTILSLWIARAIALGVSLPTVRQQAQPLPDDFACLRSVTPARLSADELSAVRHHVAESFAPSRKRWYALKLRRSTSFDSLQTYIENSLGKYYDPDTLFYPRKEVSRRVNKKIVTDTVPVIPDVVFFHVYPRQVRSLDSHIKTETLGWVFRTANTPGSDYSIIDPRSMTAFQHMIGVFTPDVKVSLTTDAPVGIGRRVLITGGIMAGYEGIIYDIRPTSDIRNIYIRLSDQYAIRTEVHVPEIYVHPLESDK